MKRYILPSFLAMAILAGGCVQKPHRWSSMPAKQAFVIVPILERSEAAPGETVAVTLEIRNPTDRTIRIPDPKKLGISFDHIGGSDGFTVLGPAIVDGPAAPPEMRLRAGEKLSAQKLFEVPKCTGALLIRSIEYQSERVQLKVFPKKKEPNPER